MHWTIKTYATYIPIMIYCYASYFITKLKKNAICNVQLLCNGFVKTNAL